MGPAAIYDDNAAALIHTKWDCLTGIGKNGLESSLVCAFIITTAWRWASAAKNHKSHVLWASFFTLCWLVVSIGLLVIHYYTGAILNVQWSKRAGGEIQFIASQWYLKREREWSTWSTIASFGSKLLGQAGLLGQWLPSFFSLCQ